MSTGTFTDIGLQKVAAAYAAGSKITITHMAFGDGDGLSVPTQTALQSERYRVAVDNKFEDPLAANTRVFVGRVAPDADHPEFNIKEIGLFDAQGDLIAVTATALIDLPSAVSDQTLDVMVEFRLTSAHAETLTIIIDPNLTYATQLYVVNSDVALEGKIKSTPIANLWRGHL